ncbi:hypothetical protein VEZ01S_19_00480 [Vibrio ezurae NBRC 102218]|uniref:Uncharacterized protein n=1 Tax=Vibrio ezurae NBRC 102218 TaxID=1219080 RepID=U3CNE8_9VIBR|nr:hypothetical protein VEZ01S_19_00480 [Vibrio ezurae NBRC 102218]
MYIIKHDNSIVTHRHLALSLYIQYIFQTIIITSRKYNNGEDDIIFMTWYGNVRLTRKYSVTITASLK